MDKAIATAEERSTRSAASENEMRYYDALEDARRNMISSMNYQWDQGFREGKKKSELRFASLVEYLMRDQRMEELQQSTKDTGLREKLYKEYGI